jgi:3-phosphoshikimate 1-carboxyvinyltransferase
MSGPDMAVAVPSRVRVHPASLRGAVLVTGDKSLSHRCLLVAALVDGEVRVEGLAPSGDVAATAAALRALGVVVDLAPQEDGRLSGTVIGPIARNVRDDVVPVDCGNSGTTLRLLAGLAAGTGRRVAMDGDASLRRRPVDRILAPLRAMGVEASARDGDRLPPLVIDGGVRHGVIWDSPVASAQIKSALLLAGVAAGVEVTVRSPRPSRDHTERMLRHAGVTVRTEERDGAETVTVVPGPLHVSRLSASRDPSAAAFWHVAAAFGAGPITTPGLCLNPGRTGALEVLRRLGADVRVTDEELRDGEPVGTVHVAPVVGATPDAPDRSATAVRPPSEAAMADGPDGGSVVIDGELVVRSLDELPVLALAGALSGRGLVVREAEELRVKESDRIATVAAMFAALGMRIEERSDGFAVPGGQQPGPGTVEAHGDHRIAMTAAIAATLGTGPVEIGGFAAVGTSYPAFLDDLRALGGNVEVLDG